MSDQQKKLAEYVYQIAAELPREALYRLTIYGEGLRDAKGLAVSAQKE